MATVTKAIVTKWCEMWGIIAFSHRNFSNSKFKVDPLAIGVENWCCAIGGAENAPVREESIIAPSHPCSRR
jgi:hypothetical protein